MAKKAARAKQETAQEEKPVVEEPQAPPKEKREPEMPETDTDVSVVVMEDIEEVEDLRPQTHEEKCHEIVNFGIARIRLGRTRTEVIRGANQAANQLMELGAETSHHRELDKAATEQCEEIAKANPKRIKAPKIERGHYLAPTPRLGERVVWYQANNPDNAFAGDVTVVQSAGRVQIRLIRPKGAATVINEYVNGVYHVTSPVHDSASSPDTVRNGSWDYLEGEKPHSGAYEPAREQITKREENVRKQAEQKAAQAEARLIQEQMRRAEIAPSIAGY